MKQTMSFIPWAEKEKVNLTIIAHPQTGESICWSNKLFKMWKSEFLKNYQNKYGNSFREDFPDKKQRAAIYENIFGVSNSGLFVRPFESVAEVTEISRNKIDDILVNMNDWKI